MDQVSGSDTTEVQQCTIQISPIAGGYRLPGTLSGVEVTLLLDTGAAVTLLRQDVWNRLAGRCHELKPWSGATLLSAGGTPLTVHGCTSLELKLGDREFMTKFVVVSPLTSEAILGIDFLHTQQAMIDLGQGKLLLQASGCDIPLGNPGPTASSPVTEQPVRIANTVEVPPRSVMEVSAYVNESAEGVWLVEEDREKKLEVAIARAIVEPKSATLPVCILNVSDKPTTLYAGCTVAVMVSVEPPAEVGSVERVGEEKVDEEKLKILQQLVANSSVELTDGEKDIFYHLLLAYPDILASSDSDLGRTGKLQHRIDTGDAQPVRQQVRRISPHRREEVKQLLSQMLERGVIEPSCSPWASPVVLVQKKDGSTRFCIDYRRLNEVTRKDAYPLPRIDLTLDSLHGSQFFSSLDLVSGYWQVELHKDDKEKTAFCTTEGLYQFRVMPFGLCNAPASFQRLMDLVLTGLQWSQCLVYLDDIIVLGRSFEEHVQNLVQVFERLRASGLKLKPSKCAFFQKEVQYLGHIISRDGIAPDPERTAKVAKWPVPTSKKEVQQFIGFANYYRRFIKDFAQHAKPLHRLTEQTSPFKWTDTCQDSFSELRKRLCTTPVLAYPDFSRPFILDTDASDVAIGGVLSQCDDNGRERVIAYGSRLLTKPERRYCVTRRQLLAVVTFVHLYRPYLICRKFTLRTDHGSLTWLKNFKEPEGQLARWLEQLQELEFDIIHRRGARHQNADALSRLPCRQCGRVETDSSPKAEVAIVDLCPPGPTTSETLRQVQLADSTLGPLLRGKEHGERPDHRVFQPLTKGALRLLQIWDQLSVHNGVLCRHRQPRGWTVGNLQVVVPETLQLEILEDLHEGAAGGHLGADKTLARLQERYYWPGQYNQVRDWCRNCGTCATRKSPVPKARAPLMPITTERPLQLVATDILGPLPESTDGNVYVLVIADYFTRYVEAYALPDQTATTVARYLVDEFFMRFSPPERLHSDQGRNFESAVIAETCKLLGIEKSRTTPYHPQSDGLVERFNRTLLDMLAKAVVDRPANWDRHLRRLCFAYNTCTHPTTGYPPFTLMFGRVARVPVDVALGTNLPPSASTIPQYVATLRQSLDTSYSYVKQQMGHELERQKRQYDNRTQGKSFERGDLVWLHSPAVPRGKSRKLHHPWTGPFRVVKRLADAVYRLQHTQGRSRPVVHFNRLKPCSRDTRLRPSHRRRPVNRTVQSHSSPPPVGTGIELLDDEADLEHDGQEQQLPSPGAELLPQPGITPPVVVNLPAHSSPSTTTPPSMPPISRRYPLRHRAPPDRLYGTSTT